MVGMMPKIIVYSMKKRIEKEIDNKEIFVIICKKNSCNLDHQLDIIIALLGLG